MRPLVGRRLLGDESWHFFSDVSAHVYLAQGVDRLRRALEELEEAQPAGEVRNDDRDQQFTQALRRMATTNLVEAFLFEQIGPGLQGDNPLFGDDANDLVSSLGESIQTSHNRSSLILTHYIYYWRAKHLLAKTPDERDLTRKELRLHLAKVRSHKSLPLIDMLEFEFIERQLHLASQPEVPSPT
ncbi:hypothetical protein [Novosphingobium sp. CF614]|uniref:hypothetical protein n=1 Tax=Novosphingobium sp. CF614 TaxID=1884364 RepID=UPI0011604CF7|nr:hypothetical protein [Novosphingobium sp. CF614]